MSRQRRSASSTLIELMVTIIAILAAIALPLYRDYVARSQAVAALNEITSGRTAYEERTNNGDRDATLFTTVDNLGMQRETERCSDGHRAGRRRGQDHPARSREIPRSIPKRST